MRQVCESCEHFEYVESAVYGRCQCYEPDSSFGGTPRAPWAETCGFFRVAVRRDTGKSNRSHNVGEGAAGKPTETINSTRACCEPESK